MLFKLVIWKSKITEQIGRNNDTLSVCHDGNHNCSIFLPFLKDGNDDNSSDVGGDGDSDSNSNGDSVGDDEEDEDDVRMRMVVKATVEDEWHEGSMSY